MIDTNELRKALLKHQPMTDPSAIELTRFMATIADELDALNAANANLEKLCDKRQKTIDVQLQRHQELTDLYNSLCDESRWQGAELCEAKARIAELEAAIVACLNENGHLADGEVCTLIDLKRAIPTWELE